MGLSQLGSVQPQIILVDLLWPATRLWASCSVERATLGVGLDASGTCENNCARLAANIYTGKCGAPDTLYPVLCKGLNSPEKKTPGSQYTPVVMVKRHRGARSLYSSTVLHMWGNLITN